MKITGLSVQVRDKNRVNVMVDGKYRFSVAIAQVVDLGLKIGNEYSGEQMQALEDEGAFGKLYIRTLEYTFVRPRSVREVKDYLYRKTRPRMTKTGEMREGVSTALTERVLERLVEKGYVNDEKFARYWVENRRLRKGVSRRHLRGELSLKGVSSSIVDQILQETSRDEQNELLKTIARKRTTYSDEKKLIAYLLRQGFSFDDIKSALHDSG